MTRKLRALGLALVAALAMSAMAATGAQAETPAHFFADTPGPVMVEGDTEKPQTLTASAGELEVICEDSSFTGEGVAPTKELTVTPTYDDCKVNQLLEATVDFTSCDYLFTAGTWNGTDAEGTVHLECEQPGDGVDITAWLPDEHPDGPPACHIFIEGGNEYSGVTYEDNGDGTVDVSAETPEEIGYTQEGTFCSGSGNDGTYDSNGPITVSGERDEAPIDIGVGPTEEEKEEEEE